ncbi:brassinosteroid LRR receptor kinase BRL3-like [Ziziphus jujuba]|uniref:Brassinosteroid LRR receptor kinase BRL3-like n=1 Tax=Ziziphus jujuba TaxID=326968 RepID=A0ABM3ZZP6_ZIZJJ|nr:brassinosteroid LRR receptor kinase BRL3-like [Ziziphus jujuba]
MSSEPSLSHFTKFNFLLYFFLWLLSSQLIKFQVVAQPLNDDDVSASGIIAEKLDLKPLPDFDEDQYCNNTAAAYEAGVYCDCSYNSSTLCHIVAISLSNRGLTGIIPAELANLTYLERLDLSNNKLHGEIPDELGTLKFLYIIDLSNNQLTGEIPRSLGNLNPYVMRIHPRLLDQQPVGVLTQYK